VTATKAKKSATQCDLDRRIRKVLAWLDAEFSAEIVAEYRKTAVEQEGDVETALWADENAMRRLG
jgi:hypothetical protein